MSDIDLQYLRDCREIESLKARYCDIADDGMNAPDKAMAAFKDVFTPDVRGDFGYMGAHAGREAMINFIVVETGKRLDWLFHAIHTPRIDVKGDTAIARWTIIARTRVRETGVQEVLVGRYTDEFRRTPEGWRISAIRWVLEP